MTEHSAQPSPEDVTEGDFRTLPTRAWSVERPDLYAFGRTKQVRVLSRDQKPKDEYRLTPDELFFLGKANFDRAQEAILNEKPPAEADLKAAETNLTDLFDRDADPKGWKLADDPARETTR